MGTKSNLTFLPTIWLYFDTQFRNLRIIVLWMGLWSYLNPLNLSLHNNGIFEIWLVLVTATSLTHMKDRGYKFCAKMPIICFYARLSRLDIHSFIVTSCWETHDLPLQNPNWSLDSRSFWTRWSYRASLKKVSKNFDITDVRLTGR